MQCARSWLLFLATAALLAPLGAAAQCTNCSTSTVGNEIVHTWTSNGTFTVPSGVTSVEVLVVAGGGGGGFPEDRTGGGGGAGGVLYNAAFPVAGVINVTVGAGGNGGVNAAGATAGANSVFGALTAIGGGRGGTGPAGSAVRATSGGSGGGGYHNPSDSGKAGTVGQGNAGGSGWDSTDVNVGFKAGGGGGAGSAGTTASAGVNGTGGAGVQHSIDGTAKFYAAGGGGGIQVYTGTTLGGSGIGGNGGANGTAGTAATANRGSGGGGGSRNINTNVAGNGGNGSAGIVIVRYTPAYFSRASGNWSANATWSIAGCGGAAATSTPSAGANVTICNNHTVTVNVPAAAQSITLQNGNNNVNLTHNAGQSLTVGAGGVTLNGNNSGNQTKAWNINAGSATVNGPVTLNGGSNNNRVARINLTTGTLDINGDLTMVAGDDERALIVATGAANVFVSGDFNFNNGTLTPGPSSTFTYDGPGGFALAQSTTISYRHLVVNKPGGTTTQNADTLTVLGDLDIQAGTVNIGTGSIAVGGTTTISGTLGFTSATGGATFTGDVTIMGGGAWNNSGNEAVTLGASLTNDGTFNSGTAQYTFTTSTTAVWAGTGGLNFGGNVAVQASRTNNTTTSVAGTTILSAGVTVTNNATFTATNSITGAHATTSVWTNAAGSTLNAGNALLTTGTLNASALDNTVAYTGAGQTMKTPSANAYHHLTLSGSGTKTPGAALTIAGNLTIHSGVTFSGTTLTHVVNGNIANAGTHSGTTGRIVLSGGAAAHVLTGAGTYENLELNDAQGATLSASPTIDNVLTLTNGVLTTGANAVFTNASCPASVSRANGWVAGNLRLRTPAGGSVTCIFHVGDATSYRPVSVTFTTLSAAGNVTGTVSQSVIDSPNIGSSTFDPAFTANRSWTITNAGANFASATAAFTYATDVDAGVDEASFVIGRFAAGAWSYLATVPGTGSAQASGLTAATLSGEFQIGEHALTLFAHWRMDQFSWNGTANEAVDSGTGSGGPFHGTASGLAPAKPTTSAASPAIAGTPGTCHYGAFNRANKDYVALPGTFPNLTASAGAFTIGAWIRTTNNAELGQRIFVDDEVNASPGGWAFSLGDGAAGALRFFYRDGTAFILDTPGVVANNTWYYAAVAVSLAAGANNSRATIYVYNTAGAQLAATSSTFTWNAGGDAGPAAIGGETNASGENNSAFGFSGNIDEVRVYRSALGAGQVDRARLETRPCTVPPAVDHYEMTLASTSISCMATTVTVTACADTSSPCTNKVLTLAGQTALLTQSAGTLGVTPVTFDAGGDAVTTLSHPAAVNGTPVTVTLSGESTAAANPRRCCPDGANCVIASSCSTTFSTAGFIFASAANGASTTVPTQVAGVDSAQMYLRAVRTNTTTKACESPLSGAATYPVNISYTCNNPGTCTSGSWMNVTPGVAAPVAVAGSVPMPFDADGNAPFTFNYRDVGAISLNASATVNSATLAGSSNAFVVKPFGVTIVGNVRRQAGNFANPGAADATGPVFARAGENLLATVRVTDAGGNATPNFGKEASAQNVTLSSALVAGLGLSANPSVTNATIPGSAFTSGQAADHVFGWGEVGIITLTPGIADYLGTNSVAGTASGNIGRFTPYDFAVGLNAPQFGAACGTFGYIGQPFAYSTAPVMTVTARNAAGGVTANYKGTTPAPQAFFKLRHGTLTPTTQAARYSAASASLDLGGVPADPTATTPDPVVASLNDGTATLTFSAGAGLALQRSAPVAPFDAEISLAVNVVDADGISFAGNPARFGQASAGNGISFGGNKQQRFGRLRMQNALASSAAIVLPVSIEAQYWNGTGFVRNAADSCTAFNRDHFSLSAYRLNLSACETRVTEGSVTLNAGAATLTLAAPGAANTGAVTLTANLGTTASGNHCAALGGPETPANAANRAYLQGAWSGATYTENPAVSATWGVFGSQPRNFIYQRENFQ